MSKKKMRPYYFNQKAMSEDLQRVHGYTYNSAKTMVSKWQPKVVKKRVVVREKNGDEVDLGVVELLEFPEEKLKGNE